MVELAIPPSSSTLIQQAFTEDDEFDHLKHELEEMKGKEGTKEDVSLETQSKILEENFSSDHILPSPLQSLEDRIRTITSHPKSPKNDTQSSTSAHSI